MTTAISPRKRIWGWYFFDWASQPYSTLLLTFVFGPYFAEIARGYFMGTGMEEEAAKAAAQPLLDKAAAAQAALDAGLGVNAGHDLNRDNLSAFVRVVPGVAEVSIGHALVADALELGYAATVRAYLDCLDTTQA